MTRACLSLLAGMYALQLSSFTESSDHLNVVLVAAFLLLLLRQVQLLVWFCAGVLLFQSAASDLIASRIPEEIAGDSIVVEILVDGFVSRQGPNVSFVASPLVDKRLPERIRLSWFQPPVDIHNGDSWKLELRLRRPRGNRNPDGFDYEAWLFREHIAAVGYVVNSRRNELLNVHLNEPVQDLRRHFIRRVSELIADPEQASVLIALVVGARHLISQEQWDRYAATGTSHLIAISGLHVGLAAGMSYFLVLFFCGLFGSRRNNHRSAILLSVVVAILYAMLAGFAVPARRASLMLVLAGAALLRRQRPSLSTVLGTTCIAISATDPLSTMAPGFILSFAAVAILIWVGQRRSNLLTLQSMLLFGLLPITAMLFDRISLAALPVNLLAVPLFSFIVVPLSLLGMLLDGPLHVAGDVLLHLSAGSISVIEKGLVIAASFEWASISVAAVFGIAWFYYLLPIIWVLLPPGWPGRYLAWLGLAAILVYRPPAPKEACAFVEVLDVGQGLAVVVRTQNHVFLYDSGPSFRGGGSAAENVVLPYLRSRGVATIDRMIISHADLDHAGGAATIAAAIPVRRVYAGEPLDDIDSVPCRAGQSWSNDGVNFRFLHPNVDTILDGNDRSCVMLLEIEGYRMLFSGDIEKYAEQSLLQRQLLRPVDAVVVPHHGSSTSSTAAFVRALRPSVAIVSAGFGNHWGFPKADIVARWEAVGAELLNTATAGAIELKICAASGLESIRRYRVDNRRIWHE